MAPSQLHNQLAVERIGENKFRSTHNPRQLGNPAPIAYGGCAAALCVRAAYETVSSNHHIYSLLGSFLGPARIDRKINCHVIRSRDTKTFATRRVVASQTLDDGSERTCAEVFVDFHIKEAALLNYSALPTQNYGSGPLDTEYTTTYFEVADNLLQEGHVTKSGADTSKRMFSMAEEFFEQRPCKSSMAAQNLMGQAKDAKTTQDHLSITERTCAEWFRAREPLSSEAENAAAMAFIMDGALSFLPLHLINKNFDHAGACSTLDFALRFMHSNVDTRKWLLKERKTIAAAEGRTYSESRLWDEDGNIVAIETQSCILRPPPTKPAKAKI